MNFKEYLDITTIKENTRLSDWITRALPLMELSTAASRYSIEVNFRTSVADSLHSFAKIALGYVSAAMKQNNFHVRQVYEEHPLRIMVSSRNFDDGEWMGVVTFNPNHDGGSFIISKGFYSKDRNSVNIQSSKKADGDSAAAITLELRNLMHSFKGMKDRHEEKLKPVALKTGPKR